jgi:hypothetical protein
MNGPHNRSYSRRFTITVNNTGNYDYISGATIYNTEFVVYDHKTGKAMDFGPSNKIANNICEVLNTMDKELDDVKKLLGLFDIDTEKYPDW